MLTITNTPMLWGLLAVFAVAAIHLWRFWRPVRKVRFTGGALLKGLDGRQSAENRLRDRLLMALRMLSVVFIVAAFAGLVWQVDEGPAAPIQPTPILGVPLGAVPREVGGDTIVVLDASASMTRVVDGVEWFSAAREVARRVIGQAEGAGVRVVVTGGRWKEQDVADVWELTSAGPVFAEGGIIYTGDLVAAISHVSAGRSPADAIAAMEKAMRLLGTRAGRIVVVTNLHQRPWQQAVARFSSTSVRGGAVSEVEWINVGGQREGENVGVVGVEFLSGRAIARTRGDLLVTAANHSASLRTIEVSLELDGQSTGRRQIVIPAWESGQALFDLSWGEQGEKTLRCKIDNAGGENVLVLDDEASWRVDVIDQPRVLLLSDEVRDAGAGDYFWRSALESGGRLRVNTRWLRELTRDCIDQSEVVVIGHVDRLSSQDSELLAEFLKRGGGVVVLAGDEAAGERWRGFETAVRRDVLAMPASWKWSRSAESTVSGSGLLRAADTAAFSAWSALVVHRRWSFERAARASEYIDSPVIYADEQPVVWTWHPWARRGGAVVVVNLGTDPAWSDVASAGVFAALAHEVVSAALQGNASLRASVVMPAEDGDMQSLRVTDITSVGAHTAPLPLNESASETVAREVKPAGRSVERPAWPWLLAAAAMLLGVESLLASPARGGSRD